jgi:hypothetical protein
VHHRGEKIRCGFLQFRIGRHKKRGERAEAWFCRESINEGLRLLKARSEKFNEIYGPSATKHRGSVMEFRLLSVVELPDDTDATV